MSIETSNVYGEEGWLLEEESGESEVNINGMQVVEYCGETQQVKCGTKLPIMTGEFADGVSGQSHCLRKLEASSNCWLCR